MYQDKRISTDKPYIGKLWWLGYFKGYFSRKWLFWSLDKRSTWSRKKAQWIISNFGESPKLAKFDKYIA